MYSLILIFRENYNTHTHGHFYGTRIVADISGIFHSESHVPQLFASQLNDTDNK